MNRTVQWEKTHTVEQLIKALQTIDNADSVYLYFGEQHITGFELIEKPLTDGSLVYDVQFNNNY